MWGGFYSYRRWVWGLFFGGSSCGLFSGLGSCCVGLVFLLQCFVCLLVCLCDFFFLQSADLGMSVK